MIVDCDVTHCGYIRPVYDRYAVHPNTKITFLTANKKLTLQLAPETLLKQYKSYIFAKLPDLKNMETIVWLQSKLKLNLF